MEQRLQTINRETYDLLSWLGDLGGLIDALYYVIFFFLKPFTTFRLSNLLLSSLFRMLPYSKQQNEDEDHIGNIVDNKITGVHDDSYKFDLGLDKSQ